MIAATTTTINLQATEKQSLAWSYLLDDHTIEIVFGGGAGGGKSVLGCQWLIAMCIKYPESKWFIGRKELKDIRQSTLITFYREAKKFGLTLNNQYKVNHQDNVIIFLNGSTIDLLDLRLEPSDPEFERLGSKEYTGGFIEESGQIVFKAKEVLKTRCRWKLDEFGLIPKIYQTCNPTKNYLYTEFYKPAKKGELPPDKAFIQALARDNPFNSVHYLNTLRKTKDKVTHERLWNGNWEYDDDPNALFAIDHITDIFTNNIDESSEYYSVTDAARKGKDRAVITVWKGLEIVAIKVFAKSRTTEIEDALDEFAVKYKIPRSHELVDEDGVGGGIVDHRRCKGFVGNSSPIQDKDFEEDTDSKVNYQNLRSQCYFTLADYVSGRKVAARHLDEEYQQAIIEELEQIKQIDVDKEGKLKIISKEDIKEKLGRSPDFADTLMMRMYFEVAKELVPGLAWI